MTKLNHATLALIATLSLSAAAPSHAEVWRLTAEVTDVAEGFQPPAFAQTGAVFTLDYEFRDSTMADTGTDFFNDVTTSISLNGEALPSSSSYIINWGGTLKALNSSVGSSAGLTFISFNASFSGLPAYATLQEAITDIASHAGSPEYMPIRLDFGPGSTSIYARTLSMAAVPEMGTWSMMALGLGLIGAVTRRRSMHVNRARA
jgi:hypothetical protein